MEILEIGAVRIAAPGYDNRGEFSRFVRLIEEPFLSDFCKRLAGISQTDVDDADAFPEVFREFLELISMIAHGPRDHLGILISSNSSRSRRMVRGALPS